MLPPQHEDPGRWKEDAKQSVKKHGYFMKRALVRFLVPAADPVCLKRGSS